MARHKSSKSSQRHVCSARSSNETPPHWQRQLQNDPQGLEEQCKLNDFQSYCAHLNLLDHEEQTHLVESALTNGMKSERVQNSRVPGHGRINTVPDITWKVRKHSRLVDISGTYVTSGMIAGAVQPLTNKSMELDYYDYTCQHCSFASYDSANLEDHIFSRTPGFGFQCHFCSFKSCTASGMRNHIEEMHSALPTDIEIISRIDKLQTADVQKASGTSSLSAQILEFSVPKAKSRHPCNFKCNRCSLSFSNLSKRKEYILDRRGPVLKCSYCELTFGFQRTLTKHVNASHVNSIPDEPALPILLKSDEDDVEPLIGNPLVEEPMEQTHENLQANLPGMKRLHCDSTCLNEQLFLGNNVECNRVSSPSSRKLSVGSTSIEEIAHEKEKEIAVRFEKGKKLFRLETEQEGVLGSQKDKLICHFCNKESKTRLHLEHHYAIHTDEDLFKCDLCSYATNSCNQLKIHQESSKGRDGNVFFCTECVFKSCTSNYFQIHLKEVHSEKKVSSLEQSEQTCPQSVQKPLEEVLRNPEVEDIQEVQHICRFCNEDLKSRLPLEADFVSHSDERFSKCVRCSYAASNESTFVRHKQARGKKEEQLYYCSKCSFKSCTSNKEEDIISLEHLDEAEPLSAATTKRATKLNPQNIPPEIEKTLEVCHFCKKVFVGSCRKRDLEQHMRIHGDEKSFKCKHCYYIGPQRAASDDHKCHQLITKYVQEIHSVNVPPKDNNSRNGNIHGRNIRTHSNSATKDRSIITRAQERIHTGEACGVVTRAVGFSRHKLRDLRSNTDGMNSNNLEVKKANIKDRIVWNTKKFKINPGKGINNGVKEWNPEKPYKCTYCAYRSKKRSNTNAHERMHTGETPYQCKACDLKFKYGSTFSRHKLTHLRSNTNTDGMNSNNLKVKKVDFKYSMHWVVCHFCSKKFEGSHKNMRLEEHIRIHTGEKPLKCNECSYICAQGAALHAHRRRHHLPSSSSISPKRNESISKSSNYTDVKSKLLVSAKIHQCKFCQYKSRHWNRIVAHTRVHTREKPFKCNYCPFESAWGHVMKTHEVRHVKRGDEMEIHQTTPQPE